MSLFKEYKEGNLVHYTEGIFQPEVCEIVNISKEKLRLRAVKSGKPYEVFFDDEENGRIHPIWLDQKAFTKLGFKDFNNHELKRITLRNDLLELISTAEIHYEEARKVYGFKGFEAKNLLNGDRFFTIDDDYLHLLYVHELQNLYSSQFRKTLDVSGLSDIQR